MANLVIRVIVQGDISMFGAKQKIKYSKDFRMHGLRRY